MMFLIVLEYGELVGIRINLSFENDVVTNTIEHLVYGFPSNETGENIPLVTGAGKELIKEDKVIASDTQSGKGIDAQQELQEKLV